MSVLKLSIADDGVATITLTNHENRFSQALSEQFSAALDAIEKDQSVIALVTTGQGKFFSLGLDQHKKDLDEFKDGLVGFQRVCSRLLTLSVPSIAALNGHAFGGGMLLAMSHDFRIMNSRKGWMCVPAVDLGISLPESLVGILRSKLNPTAFRDVLLVGQRFSASQALTAHILDAIAEPAELLPQALALARKVGKRTRSRVIVRETKKRMQQPVLAIMDKNSLLPKSAL